MSKAGLLPDDLFKGENITLAEKYETYQWWYEKTFTYEESALRDVRLHFFGVDCYAEYFLNGMSIGESDNMLIPVILSVSGVIKTGENVLQVKIKSALLTEARNCELSVYLLGPS